jgi:hypothetical protein
VSYDTRVAVHRDSVSAGAEGTLPADFVPWQRGATCTVRPEWLAPFDDGRTYLANVTVQRSVPLDESFVDYGRLYDRATATVRRHLLDRAGTADPRTWIQAHAWFRIDLPHVALVSATVTLGVTVTSNYASAPEGEPLPSVESLRHPSGHNPESLAARHQDESGLRRVHHLYTDFDRTGGSSRDVTLSYGEYASEPPVDYAAFVRRAERCMESSASSLELLFREWRTIRTDKKTDLPWIVVMESYLRQY